VNGARRLLLSGIALTVLLAVVALASRAHRPGGGTGGGRGHVPTIVGEYLGVTMLALMLGVAVLVGWGFATNRRNRVLAGQTNWRRTLGGIAVLAIALVVAVAARERLNQNGSRRPVQVPAAQLKELRSQGKEQKGTVERVESSWLTAVILASILLGSAIAAALAARQRLRHGDELEDEAALARALDEVLADTLDDLRAQRDPRTAVIEVYARMERTFAAYRVARRPAETPLEYVARVLDSLSVSAHAVRRVTLLYERAKFSAHEIDGGMKDDAIEALAGVRAELEAARAEAA
jgi:hypothetical protein